RLNARALQSFVNEIRQAMLVQFKREGFPPDKVAFACDVDMRFLGQASEIRLALKTLQISEVSLREMEETFKAEHERLYGHRSDPDNLVEIIAVRLVGRAGAHEHGSPLRPAERVDAKAETSRRAYFGDRWGTVDTSVIARRQLAKPTSGPLLIDE